MNNIKIIYNPDYYMVNKTIENLNDKNIDIIYKFENQKISTLAMDSKTKEFCNSPLSNMNESGDYVLNCAYIRNCQFNGWFSKPKTNDLNLYDIDMWYTGFIWQQWYFRKMWNPCKLLNINSVMEIISLPRTICIKYIDM